MDRYESLASEFERLEKERLALTLRIDLIKTKSDTDIAALNDRVDERHKRETRGARYKKTASDYRSLAAFAFTLLAFTHVIFFFYKR